MIWCGSTEVYLTESSAHATIENLEHALESSDDAIPSSMALFERLHDAGNTIVLVTHEADIAGYAHRVVHIRDGKIERDVKKAA